MQRQREHLAIDLIKNTEQSQQSYRDIPIAYNPYDKKQNIEEGTNLLKHFPNLNTLTQPTFVANNNDNQNTLTPPEAPTAAPPSVSSPSSRTSISLPKAYKNHPPFVRYRAPADRFFRDISNDIIYNTWYTSWARNAASQFTSVNIGNDLGYVSGGLGLRDGITSFATGWRKLVVEAYTNRLNEEVAIGVARGDYGIFVDRSNLKRATAIEVLARNFAEATLVDFTDRDYGQRIHVRNFDITLRHDFDEFELPDPDEFATDVQISFRKFAIGLNLDAGDQRYGISIGYRGHQVSVLHDFNDRYSEVLGKWGKGWQLYMLTDFIDRFSEALGIRIGFGRLNRAYMAVGAGVESSGVPQGSFEIQLPDSGLFVKFADLNGERALQFILNVGKFTYNWKSGLSLNNLRLPVLFGVMDPAIIQQLLSGKQIEG